MKKFAAFLFTALFTVTLASVGVCAAVTADMPYTSATGFDKDGGALSSVLVQNGTVTADSITPDQKIYIELPGSGSTITLSGGTGFSAEELYNSDQFTFKLDRDENSKYLDEVKLVSKRLDGTNRKYYIEVSLKPSTTVEEKKVTFDVFFRARRAESGKWNSGDTVNTRFSLWVKNETAKGEDATIGTGEGVVFSPTSNEKNTITWGNDYDVASLEFTANSDAKDFYARLSTRIDRDIYDEYGDPVDADLFFRTFTGNPRIDSTSRATLTLYNPWSEDYYDRYDYLVDPTEVYIYSVDPDGYLEDITNLFTYVNGDNTEAGVDGWQTKVRTLGQYVISDVELFYDEAETSEEAPIISKPIAPPPTPGTAVPLPSTGSHDMLAGAAALAAVSLGVIIFSRKRR